MTRCFATPLVQALHDHKRWRTTRGLPLLLVCGSALVPSLAVAQESTADAGQTKGQRPGWVVTPSITVDGTYTDNVNLSANKKADFITRISPGVILNGNSGRASATLNYQWQFNRYAEQSTANGQQRSLAALKSPISTKIIIRSGMSATEW